jgi:TRAP-type C4-dicarboxylate transport system permease small subunit
VPSPLERLSRGAELLAGAMFAAMFAAFVVQVVSRYVFDDPVSWTIEICSIAYIWIVFFGGAIVVTQRQHITFDMLYKSVGSRWRRRFAIVNTLSIGIVFLAALPGTIDYVLFAGHARTLILHIRLDVLYACFAFFMLGSIVAAAVRLRHLLGPRWRDDI